MPESRVTETAGAGAQTQTAGTCREEAQERVHTELYPINLSAEFAEI